MISSARWTVVVLAGGGGVRLGGADKATLRLGTLTMIDTLLAAVPPDVPVVVAGAPQATNRSVTFRPESPAGGGPVAGIASAVAEVMTPHTVVVAVDMPWAGSLLAEIEGVLLQTEPSVDAVVPVAADGHQQVLLTAWRTGALRGALADLGEPRDRSVRDLIGLASCVDWPLTPSQSRDVVDVDTPADLGLARRRAQDEAPPG